MVPAVYYHKLPTTIVTSLILSNFATSFLASFPGPIRKFFVWGLGTRLPRSLPQCLKCMLLAHTCPTMSCIQLVICTGRYEVNFQNGLTCGGAYIKLLSYSEDLDLVCAHSVLW